MSQTVYIGKQTSRYNKVYHTNGGCERLKTTKIEKDRDILEDWGYRECKVCSGEFENNSGGKGEGSRKPLRDLVESGEIEHD